MAVDCVWCGGILRCSGYGVLTAGFIASAVSGVARGIRWLSNINMVLAVGLALFFFVLGPTAFLLNFVPSVIVTYFAELPTMLSASMSDGPEMQAFLSSWTTFYWAWWVSWAPFVGVFVAKISRGRTIRQFILGVLFIPSSIVVMAFTVLGGTAIHQQILIERDTQKAIVLGKGGARIKAIGAAARAEMEKQLERRVHLFLHVKVKPGWADDRGVWRDLGIDWVE